MLKQGKHLWNLHTLHLGIGRLAEAQKMWSKSGQKLFFLELSNSTRKLVGAGLYECNRHAWIMKYCETNFCDQIMCFKFWTTSHIEGFDIAS